MNSKQLIERIEEMGNNRKNVNIIFTADERGNILGFKVYAGKPNKIRYITLDKSHTMSYLYCRNEIYQKDAGGYPIGLERGLTDYEKDVSDDTRIMSKEEIAQAYLKGL